MKKLMALVLVILVTAQDKGLHDSLVAQDGPLIVPWKTVDLTKHEVPGDVLNKAGLVQIENGFVDIPGFSIYFQRAGFSETAEIMADIQSDNGMQADMQANNGMQADGSIGDAAAEMANNETSTGVDILLLHGAVYSSETWKSLNTINMLAAMGHRVAAIDLPGFFRGRSTRTRGIADRSTFMMMIIDALGLVKPVIISPSASGSYALPYLFAHFDKMGGFIPVAPGAASTYSAEDYKKVTIPAMIVYGSRDRGAAFSAELMNNIPDSQIEIIPGGSHAAYLHDRGQLWHKLLYNFLGLLAGSISV